MRNRQIGILGAFLFLLFIIYSLSSVSRIQRPKIQESEERPAHKGPTTWEGGDAPSAEIDHTHDTKPKAGPSGTHPILHLVSKAEKEFEKVKQRQSKTLGEAVAEYKRRYGMPPPPNFDKWWEFAKKKNVQLVDEFDTIYTSLTPFWGLKPSTIRARAREAIGFDNGLMGVQIRGGKVEHVLGGWTWLQDNTQEMMADFVQYLPDMDLAFNINDEPRVVVQHDDLSRHVQKALEVNIPATIKPGKKLRNSFTQHPNGLNYEGRFDMIKLTRFNYFAHQPTWLHSRISCPPNSPARILEEDEQFDDREKYSLGELGFVTNWTALSDVCLTPSLGSTFGFFDRPNAFGVTHDLFPIFSQSKVSSYNDIIYPSPWYFAQKVPYIEEQDPTWEEKHNRLYWRGSTTGGFSRNGGWRRQHRQRFVKKINDVDTAKILVKNSTASDKWTVKSVPRGDFRSIIDVFFSHIGQCDPGDCDAQKEFFDVKEYAKFEEGMKYRHVLDMDGNAFSGRFYAFLKSRSLVYKFAIFREWHYEWLRPWAHYVPLSLQGDEWLESVRFFAEDKENGGTKEAERMAKMGREWANKVLRNEDLEVWFFRLLLE